IPKLDGKGGRMLRGGRATVSSPRRWERWQIRSRGGLRTAGPTLIQWQWLRGDLSLMSRFEGFSSVAKLLGTVLGRAFSVHRAEAPVLMRVAQKLDLIFTVLVGTHIGSYSSNPKSQIPNPKSKISP